MVCVCMFGARHAWYWLVACLRWFGWGRRARGEKKKNKKLLDGLLSVECQSLHCTHHFLGLFALHSPLSLRAPNISVFLTKQNAIVLCVVTRYCPNRKAPARHRPPSPPSTSSCAIARYFFASSRSFGTPSPFEQRSEGVKE